MIYMSNSTHRNGANKYSYMLELLETPAENEISYWTGYLVEFQFRVGVGCQCRI